MKGKSRLPVESESESSDSEHEEEEEDDEFVADIKKKFNEIGDKHYLESKVKIKLEDNDRRSCCFGNCKRVSTYCVGCSTSLLKKPTIKWYCHNHHSMHVTDLCTQAYLEVYGPNGSISRGGK